MVEMAAIDWLRFSVLIVAVPVPKEVQQRAGEEQKIGNSSQNVAGVGPKQKSPNRRNAKHRDQTSF